MKRLVLLGVVLGGLLAAAAAQNAWALEFPATFSGRRTVTYTTVNTGALPPSTCTAEAALSITLAGNGTLSYEAGQVIVSVDQQTGRCSMRATERTSTVTGTHDLQGNFSVVFNQANDLTLTGSYDDEHITASFKSDYTVYFGPFVSALAVGDLRCVQRTPADRYIAVYQVTVGNIGIDSPDTAIYIGLARPDLSDIWTYHAADMGTGRTDLAWWQGSVRPYLAGVVAASGWFGQQPEFKVPAWNSVAAGSGSPASRLEPFPAGTFKFMVTAVDTRTGAYRLYEQAGVKTCVESE